MGAYSSNGSDPKNGIFANVTIYAYNKVIAAAGEVMALHAA